MICRRFFDGPHHFLGGRFVPPGIATKYALKLPAYPGLEQCVRLEEWGQQQTASGKKAGDSSQDNSTATAADSTAAEEASKPEL